MRSPHQHVGLQPLPRGRSLCPTSAPHGRRYAHLTNTSINKNSTSYASDKEGIRGGCKWSLLRFQREHPDHPLNQPLLWRRIRAIINLTLLSIAADIPDNGGGLLVLSVPVLAIVVLTSLCLHGSTHHGSNHHGSTHHGTAL